MVLRVHKKYVQVLKYRKMSSLWEARQYGHLLSYPLIKRTKGGHVMGDFTFCMRTEFHNKMSCLGH